MEPNLVKTNDEIDTLTRQKTEDWLLKRAKWTIRSVLLTGYFPFSIQTTNNKLYLVFKYFSPQILFMFVMSVMNIYTIIKITLTRRLLGLWFDSGALGVTVVGWAYVSMICTSGIRFYVIWRFPHMKILKFWTEFVRFCTLMKIKLSWSSSCLSEIDSSTASCHHFKMYYFLNLAAIIFQFLYVTTNISGSTDSKGVELAEVLFLDLMPLLHFGNVFWMQFFIVHFSSSFSILSDELNETEMNKNSTIDVNARFESVLSLFDNLEILIQKFITHFHIDILTEAVFTLTTAVGYTFYLIKLLILQRPWIELMPSGIYLCLLTHNFLLFCNKCDKMTENGHKFICKLQNLSGCDLACDLRYKVLLLSLRSSSNILGIGHDFFNVNRAMIMSIIATVLTYIIVLLQFLNSESS